MDAPLHDLTLECSKIKISFCNDSKEKERDSFKKCEKTRAWTEMIMRKEHVKILKAC